ncbi:MAG: redoxin family protein, partial [Actinomycetota bacterium]|nr:redoxin family protein [Actinomycetota bacterium]
QTTGYQRELVERLHLPYPILSDAALELTHALRLPTLEFDGATLLRRFTLVVECGRIEHVFYPVFPPDRDAETVLAWLAGNRG